MRNKVFNTQLTSTYALYVYGVLSRLLARNYEKQSKNEYRSQRVIIALEKIITRLQSWPPSMITLKHDKAAPIAILSFAT